MKEKIINPFIMLLPAIFTLTLVALGLIWLFLIQLTGPLAIFKIFLPIARIATVISGIGFVVCLVVLLVKGNLKAYIRSITPTIYLHDNLKVHARVSDYKNDRQPLSSVEREYNSCIFNSYIFLEEKTLTVVVTVPKGGEAQEILNKRLSILRKDLVPRFSDYSFDGRFEQVGNFMILQGSRN